MSSEPNDLAPVSFTPMQKAIAETIRAHLSNVLPAWHPLRLTTSFGLHEMVVAIEAAVVRAALEGMREDVMEYSMSMDARTSFQVIDLIDARLDALKETDHE